MHPAKNLSTRLEVLKMILLVPMNIRFDRDKNVIKSF
jgi:hypothetical protein